MKNTDFHGKNTDFPHEIVACLDMFNQIDVKVRSHELVLSDVLCRCQNWENVQTSDVRPRYVNLI